MLRTLAEWQEHVYEGGEADPVDILKDWEENVAELEEYARSMIFEDPYFPTICIQKAKK